MHTSLSGSGTPRFRHHQSNSMARKKTRLKHSSPASWYKTRRGIRHTTPQQEKQTCACFSKGLRVLLPVSICVPAPPQSGGIHPCEVIVSVDSAAVGRGKKQPLLHDLFETTQDDKTRQQRQVSSVKKVKHSRSLKRRRLSYDARCTRRVNGTH